jgi:DnaJ-class molecular chaperone
MAEESDQQPPVPCSACRGTGSVISNLGGVAATLPCPWCEGSGVWLRGHDAQAHWRDQGDSTVV